ncbi:hypothetical protein V5O48_013301, partial [Marasmius crinis-equi]
ITSQGVPYALTPSRKASSSSALDTTSSTTSADLYDLLDKYFADTARELLISAPQDSDLIHYMISRFNRYSAGADAASGLLHYVNRRYRERTLEEDRDWLSFGDTFEHVVKGFKLTDTMEEIARKIKEKRIAELRKWGYVEGAEGEGVVSLAEAKACAEAASPVDRIVRISSLAHRRFRTEFVEPLLAVPKGSRKKKNRKGGGTGTASASESGPPGSNGRLARVVKELLKSEGGDEEERYQSAMQLAKMLKKVGVDHPLRKNLEGFVASRKTSSRSSHRCARIAQLETEQPLEDFEAFRVLRETKVEVEGEVEGGSGWDLDGLSWRKRSLDVTNNTAEDDSTIRVPKGNVSLLPISESPPLQAPSDSLSRSYFPKKATVRILASGTRRQKDKEKSSQGRLSGLRKQRRAARSALLTTIEPQEAIAFPSSPDLHKEDMEATIKLPIAKRKCRPSAPALFPPSPPPAPVMGPRVRRPALSTDKPPNALIMSRRTRANTLGSMLVLVRREESEKDATIKQRKLSRPPLRRANSCSSIITHRGWDRAYTFINISGGPPTLLGSRTV